MLKQTLRPRRLRRTANIRAMVRETELSVKDFVYPIFVVPGENIKEEIPSMPGCFHLSVDRAVEQAKELAALGIPSVEVFGLPEYKDEIGSSAWDAKSPVQQAIRAIKQAEPELGVLDQIQAQGATTGTLGTVYALSGTGDGTASDERVQVTPVDMVPVDVPEVDSAVSDAQLVQDAQVVGSSGDDSTVPASGVSGDDSTVPAGDDTAPAVDDSTVPASYEDDSNN